MSDMIVRGKALYWGTSEWSADEIRAACEIAERHHLHKPVVEQPQYNLFHRTRVEQEYARLYEDYGLGLTTRVRWHRACSPASIVTACRPAAAPVTGLRLDARPPDQSGRQRHRRTARHNCSRAGCSTAQLAIAWVLANPRVSSVITGASRIEQISDNMRALDVAAKLTPDVKQRIEEVVGDAYE